MKKNLETAKTIATNVLEFLDGLFLLILSLFGLYQGYENDKLNWIFANVLMVASVFIGCQAFYLLGKHFNKTAK